MKITTIISLVLTLFFSAFVSAKVHTGVEVDVKAVKGNLNNEQDVILKVTYKNRTNQAIKLLKWYLPDVNGNIEDGIFKITYNGESIDYLGRHYKRPAAEEVDYFTLRPHKKVSYMVDLTRLYDFYEEGLYQIHLEVDNQAMFGLIDSNKPNGDRPSALKSNKPIDIYVGKGVVAKKPCNPRKEDCGEPPSGGDISFSGGCSNSEQSTLMSAVDAAKAMTNDSVSYLNGSAGERYTTWFGAYSSSRFNKVVSNFDAIKDALDNKPKTLDCSCNQRYYAYVYPSQPYKVYVCRAFWSAPMTGTDSKGGTLVHEMSHFNVVAGTDDHVYGQSGAMSLADSDPNRAIANADNHEYFAENKPSLD